MCACMYICTYTCSSAHMHIHAQVIYPCMPMWRPEIETLVYFTEPLLHIPLYLSQGLSLNPQVSISFRLSSHQAAESSFICLSSAKVKDILCQVPPFTWYQSSGLNAGIAIPSCPETPLTPLWICLHITSYKCDALRYYLFLLILKAEIYFCLYT